MPCFALISSSSSSTSHFIPWPTPALLTTHHSPLAHSLTHPSPKMMRSIDPPLTINDRKGLARHQLNLPIARPSINLANSHPTRTARPALGPTTAPSTSSISTSTSTSPSWSPSPSPKVSTAPEHGPLSVSKKNAIQESEPPSSTRVPLRISSPRQPVLPKLLVRVPEISARFHEPCQASSSPLTSPTKTGVYSSYRRVSWSPSQAIPEGHYSKGFTLTASTPHPATPAATTSSLRRANTVHLQRRETLSPLRRLVGRSKSMKVKVAMTFAPLEADSGVVSMEKGNYRTLDTTAATTIAKENTYNVGVLQPHDSNKDRPVNGAMPEDVINTVNVNKPLPSITIAANSKLPSKTIISTVGSGMCKPLWQHSEGAADAIQSMGLAARDVQKQETIFELISTEAEYVEDLGNIFRIFADELEHRLLETRKKKKPAADKMDLRLRPMFGRLLNHIRDLRNGHHSLLKSLRKQQEATGPVVEEIGMIFWKEFYMFRIYDTYFAQYSVLSKDFQAITTGTSELSLVIKDLLKSPKLKSLTLEGIFLKPIQRLQKYPLFFKDIMALTARNHVDFVHLEQALNNHQKELTKIDERIWIEHHNEMLKDLQQRIKGLPTSFNLVEQHRYLLLDGPVYRIAARQPSKTSTSTSGVKDIHQSLSLPNPDHDWRDGFRATMGGLKTAEDNTPTVIHRPSQLDYHHLHAKPAVMSSSPSSSSSTLSGHASFSFLSASSPTSPGGLAHTPRAKSYVEPSFDRYSSHPTFSSISPTSPPSATTLSSLSSWNGNGPVSSASLHQPPLSNSKQQSGRLQQPQSFASTSPHGSFSYLSSSFSNLSGHPRNISSSALHLPGVMKNTTDTEAEYHVFVFTDIVLWTKRVMSRYHRKEGTPWHFKLVEPVSRLTSVCNTTEDNIFMCTSVHTSSTSYLVRTEDEVAARMWRTTIPTLVPFHCSRSQRDRGKQ